MSWCPSLGTGERGRIVGRDRTLDIIRHSMEIFGLFRMLRAAMDGEKIVETGM
ncbi:MULTISPECIES: hypothetical protein [Bradyrhizobium]|uniref:hypothetical protein n=1 Tax=Bradyrhizobium elkanii TaxID=29448 RepID=UPI000410B086|nr:hypothetical protein [Bradyrhizobium elkanii]